MSIYTIRIHDTKYSSWDIYENENGEKTDDLQIDPIINKLFSNDTFLYENCAVQRKTSPVRSGKEMTGVLLLEQNKTFGRTNNKKRLLYKCIPNDRELPIFLVPYEPTVSFSKIQKNKYVVFVYENWNNTHPQGLLKNVIGDVDVLDNYYEYQLVSKGLTHSLSGWTKQIRKQLGYKPIEKYIQEITAKYGLEDRTHLNHIFTIDGENCLDMDDAVSFQRNENHTYSVSVYIANVVLWMETFGLWDAFTESVATVYLPHKKCGMLPNILSDDLCSLIEGHTRVAFALDMVFADDGKLLSFSFHNVLIQVSKNYVYEETALRHNTGYNDLFDFTRKMSDIKTSVELVSFWMIKTNAICGEHMRENRIGVFRSTVKNENIPVFFQEVWAGHSGTYVLYSSEVVHEVMKINHYTHITSPIRRLVDLLNQLWFIRLSVSCSPESLAFLENWISKIDGLNETMRTIKKVETDSWLLFHFYKDPNIIGRVHKGVILDKTKRGELYEYSVYLEEYRLFTRFKSEEELDRYFEYAFRLYIFEREHELKKKVRIQLG